ncbi:MAG: hypothetical protein M3441_04860 [Chloroflexota bacterium]|nr:hypothetical protein [Chloroflexota bacterium]
MIWAVMNVHSPSNRIAETEAGPNGLGFGRASVSNAFGGWYYYWYYEVPGQ